jgi:hypothetical protein
MADITQDTIDRVAIMDLLARYNRGVDRCDLDTLNGVWAEGATTDYGANGGDAREWSANTVASLRANFLRTQHMLGQMVIDLDGDRATAETYCRAYHEFEGPDGREEMTVGGRYLDDLVRTPTGWRIAKRRYVMDWNANRPSTAKWDQGLYAMLARRSARHPDDALYTGQ